jgi:hypothetical protein
MSHSNHYDLIHQTILFGNPFEAIELNLFSCGEYVDYLARNAKELPREKLHLSFCALMKNYPTVYHYSNGQHILSFFPKDTMINRMFLILGGSPELPISKDDLNHCLWSILFDEYSDFMNDVWSEEIEKVMLLCDKITSKLLKRKFVYPEKEFIQTLYNFRCEKVLSKYPNMISTLSFSIDTDWFVRYPIVKNHYHNFIHRIFHLQKNAPLYYEAVKSQFMTLFSEITIKEFEILDSNLLKITCQAFPDQFSNIEIKEDFQKICIYPINIRAYILGLSIFPKIPNKKMIESSLIHLSEIGIDAYVNEIIEKQEKEDRPKYKEDQIANSEDTLFEEPKYYHNFDYLDIEENGKIYQFTRPEFQKLLTDKKNFWTKQPISFSDLYTIQNRIQLAKVMNLPNPETLKVLIEKACKGILFQESLTQQSLPQESSNISSHSNVSNNSSNVNSSSRSLSSLSLSNLEQNPSLSFSIQMLDNPNISSQFSNSLLQFFQSYLNNPSIQNYMNQINLNQVGQDGFVHSTIEEVEEQEQEEREQEEQEQEEHEQEEREQEEHEQEEHEQEEHEQEEQEQQ